MEKKLSTKHYLYTIGGGSWDNLLEIFSGCQWMANIPNAVEILPKI